MTQHTELTDDQTKAARWLDEVRQYLTAAADSSMSRNNSEQLAYELLEALPANALEAQAREIEGLRKVLAPFAAYEQVRSTMGGCTPKEGSLWAVEARGGRAELTVEDMQAAVAAMATKGQP